MPLPQVCVTYLLRNGSNDFEVLLGRKKRGLGVSKFVGLGGKLRPGEHPRTAAVREIGEEARLIVDPGQLQHVGLLSYIFSGNPSLSQESWVYLCRNWVGEPAESDEIAPQWHPSRELPFDRMWSDASHWLPQALHGTFTRASYVFAEDMHTVISSDNPEDPLPKIPPPSTFYAS